MLDEKGDEIGRIGLTGLTGSLSMTVTTANEAALEPFFGKGWLD